ncbi:pyridoxamine 5'-phosphate oxidase family protein [Actinoplanes sp. NPDC049265]|uniref:pyridoxamine 5'-phosphate oxidase family protein n=1 Tax=Actinoplanes sp. NPDC049265 TaxID=3363902 RepID=UPI00371AC851
MTTPISETLRSRVTVPRLDLDWSGALAKISEAETYLVATVSPAGRPHAVPVLAVWVTDTLVFNTEVSARKARHLVQNPAVAVSVAGEKYDFTIEGTAEQLVDTAALQAVADAFPRKYAWWHPQVIDGHFVADDPGIIRAVYAIHPEQIFGFGKTKGFSATRWRFPTVL